MHLSCTGGPGLQRWLHGLLPYPGEHFLPLPSCTFPLFSFPSSTSKQTLLEPTLAKHNGGGYPVVMVLLIVYNCDDPPLLPSTLSNYSPLLTPHFILYCLLSQSRDLKKSFLFVTRMY